MIRFIITTIRKYDNGSYREAEVVVKQNDNVRKFFVRINQVTEIEAESVDVVRKDVFELTKLENYKEIIC